MNSDEILKKVNPIYFSAKACLWLLKDTGDADITRFYNEIDKEQLVSVDVSPEDLMTKARIISIEVRYNVWNVIAKETDCKNIVDLPCGYLPHSLTAARLNKKYYGLDLPIVIEEINPVADKYLNGHEKTFVKYHVADATNYSSMRNALKNVQGNICIITDGLLGYFNSLDLKTVCENIHRLLQEFGGYWYTSDFQFSELMAVTYATIGGNKEEMLQANISGSSLVADNDNSEYLFQSGTLVERKYFLENCGFNVETFSYTEKLNSLLSLKDNPVLMKKLLAAYQEISALKLTVKNTGSTENKKKHIPFAQEFSLVGDILSLHISGRLDTLTATELLKSYEEQRAKNIFTEINIDATNLEFISFAGLRAFKIIRESLKDGGLFKITNANDEVHKILDENGLI